MACAAFLEINAIGVPTYQADMYIGSEFRDDRSRDIDKSRECDVAAASSRVLFYESHTYIGRAKPCPGEREFGVRNIPFRENWNFASALFTSVERGGCRRIRNAFTKLVWAP